MTKFKLIEDLKVVNELILPKGSIIIFDENNEILINTDFGYLRFNKEKISNIIEEYKEIDIKISPLEDVDKEQWYRLQLDVKTTKDKAIKIDNYLREQIKNMI